jgi:hypothetical protein
MTTASAHPTQINGRKKKIIRMHLSPACTFIELSAAALVVGFINGSVFCLIAAAVSDKRDVQLSVCSRQWCAHELLRTRPIYILINNRAIRLLL